MESSLFIDITLTSGLALFVVGFVGGMVSGFIGSGGAFVLTPAMMTLGVPGIVAVASNICHKFPKSLVGAMKRHKYGQVDVKLGLIMGLFAEGGMLVGKQVMTGIKHTYGDVGTSLYVSVVFVIVLAIVGGFVLRDAYRMFQQEKAAGVSRRPIRSPAWRAGSSPSASPGPWSGSPVSRLRSRCCSSPPWVSPRACWRPPSPWVASSASRQ